MDNLKKAGAPGNEIRVVSHPDTAESGDGVRSTSRTLVVEDEISLIDIWLVLVHRKWVIVIGLLLGAAIAVAFAIFVPKKYRFYTTVALGQQTIKGGGETKIVPLDSPETALAKLKEGYLPQVLEQAATKSENVRGYRLQAKNPKGSTTL